MKFSIFNSQIQFLNMQHTIFLTVLSFDSPFFWDIFIPLLIFSAIALYLGHWVSSYFSGKKIAGLNAKLQDLQDRYAQLDKSNQATLAQKAVLEEENREYVLALEAEKALVVDWTAKHDKVSYSFDTLNKKHLDLFSKHTDLEKAHESLQMALESLQKSHTDLETQYKQKEIEVAEYQQEMVKNVAAWDAISASIEELKAQYAEKQEEWTQKETNFQSEVSHWHQKYHELADKVEGASAHSV